MKNVLTRTGWAVLILLSFLLALALYLERTNTGGNSSNSDEYYIEGS